jgi:hypothetical protein
MSNKLLAKVIRNVQLIETSSRSALKIKESHGLRIVYYLYDVPSID